MEARSARIELLYNIGYLHWRLNNSVEAKAAFTNGLELAPDAALPGTRAQLLHGLAVLDYEAGNFASSAEIYKKALALSPHDSSLLINLSATCCMLGRNHEAITNSKRALRVNASDGRIWNRLGYIYVAMGKMPEAVTCFLKAVEVAPKISAYHESLAIVYSLTDRSDQSLRELTISRQLYGARPGWELDLYKEVILGHTEQALESLKAALNQKWILIHEVRRDPNLNVLLKSAQIAELINKLAT